MLRGLAGIVLASSILISPATAQEQTLVDIELKKVRQSSITKAAAESNLREESTRYVRDLVLADSHRVPVRTNHLEGSISLFGARFDDLVLLGSDLATHDQMRTRLLSPAGIQGAAFAEFGLTSLSGANTLKLPDHETLWTVSSSAPHLTTDTPLLLSYDNGEGLIFSREISVDDEFLFTVSTVVENTGNVDVAIFHFARVVRMGSPYAPWSALQHQGPIAALGPQRPFSETYQELKSSEIFDFTETYGWLGFVDTYWLTVMIANQNELINARFSYFLSGDESGYQANYVERRPAQIAPGQKMEFVSYFLAGARNKSVIDSYERNYGFARLGFLNY